MCREYQKRWDRQKSRLRASRRGAPGSEPLEKASENEHRHAQFGRGRQVGRDLRRDERHFVFVSEERHRVAIAPAVELRETGAQKCCGDADTNDNCDQVAGYFSNKAVALAIKLYMTQVLLAQMKRESRQWPGIKNINLLP
jgi:hypothetical protein